MRFRQAEFVEVLECKFEAHLRDRILTFSRKRVFYIFSTMPLKCEYVLETVLETLLATLDGNPHEYHIGKLREKLFGNLNVLIDKGKQDVIGIGTRWEKRLDIKMLSDLVIDARLQGDTLLVLNVIHQRDLKTISLNDILAFSSLPLIGDISLRRANDIMLEMERRGFVERNGNLFKSGRDVLI